jgi:membrane protein insertase Oxa1/YidC/SpoIIIJ
MSEAWGIAIITLVVTTTLSMLGMGIKALWSIAKTFKQLVTQPECDKAMGEQCKDIASLKKGFEENKSAIRQMILAFKQLHNVNIEYKG